MAFPKLTKLERRTLLLIAAGLAAVAGPMAAQQTEKTAPISFEVASVKSSDTGSEDRCKPNASVGETFTVKNCQLGALIVFSYDGLLSQKCN